MRYLDILQARPGLPAEFSQKQSRAWQIQTFSLYDPNKDAWLSTPAFSSFDPNIFFPIYDCWKNLPLEMRTPNRWGVVLGVARRAYQWTLMDKIKVDLLKGNPKAAWQYCDDWLGVNYLLMK